MPTLNNKLARVFRVDGVAIFYPGLNQVDTETLRKCCEHPMFDARVVSGELEISDHDLVPQVAASVEGTEEVDNKTFSVLEMKELIAGTLNIPDLEKIIEADPRKQVVAAARAQIARLRQETE